MVVGLALLGLAFESTLPPLILFLILAILAVLVIEWRTPAMCIVSIMVKAAAYLLPCTGIHQSL